MLATSVVVAYYFFSRILYISVSYILTTIVILYIFNIIDFLGNYILINIYYNLIYRILRVRYIIVKRK
jgi:hypothetical protein